MKLRCLAYTQSSVQSPALHTSDVAVHACKPNSQGIEAGGSEVRGHSWLRSKFEASLAYIRQAVK